MYGSDTVYGTHCRVLHDRFVHLLRVYQNILETYSTVMHWDMKIRKTPRTDTNIWIIITRIHILGKLHNSDVTLVYSRIFLPCVTSP